MVSKLNNQIIFLHITFIITKFNNIVQFFVANICTRLKLQNDQNMYNIKL